MASIFTYQMAGCVLITPQYVPGIVTHSEIVNALGGVRHTQALDTPDVELAVYGTVQVINAKQPPPHQGNLSITETGSESLSRLEKVAHAAFRLAIKEQNAAAMGINFSATVALPTQDAKALLFNLVDHKIIKQSTNAKGALKTAGLKLIYDYQPWLATLQIEVDPNNEKQLVCAVNFNINTPNKGGISLIRQAGKLRVWLEQTVTEIVGKGSNA